MVKTAIILLSGGLDSVVSLAKTQKEMDIKLALTFDYGQKSAEQEIKASKKIAEFYHIKHKVIELPWLEEITQTSLVNKNAEIPNLDELDNIKKATETAKAVWVPNRNGALLNIAASFCDSMNLDHIIFGANKEEGTTFPDNTQEFIDKINESLEYSTLAKPKVIAPLITLYKAQIVDLGADLDVPFELIRSCYTNKEKHCGECESCKRFKRALKETQHTELIERIF